MDALLTAGVSLKPEHFEAAVQAQAGGLWFELHPENYLVDGGARLRWLDAIRARHPLSLHGVSFSLAGDAPPDRDHLQRLVALARRVEPALISEHLAWSRWGGRYVPDLLPFVRTTEALQRIASHVACVQDALGAPIALENPAHYLQIDGHEWDEIDFLAELARRTGCRLLLDINNVHVSARNLGYCAPDWLDRFPARLVSEVHLAGHSVDPALGEALLIDSHDTPVAPAVWSLYRRFVARAGVRPTLVERDGNLPAFATLLDERNQAASILAQSAECNAAECRVAGPDGWPAAAPRVAAGVLP